MSKAKLFAGILERTIDLRPRSRVESRRWTTLCHHQGRYICWDTNIFKILEFVKQQCLQNINLGELPIFVIYKYFKNINISYPWISHSGLKQQGRYPQSLKVPATTSASGEFDYKLSKTISSKYLFLQIIQSSNFFQIYVPPKSFNRQISSKYLFLQNIIIIKFLPSTCSSELFNDQMCSK